MNTTHEPALSKDFFTSLFDSEKKDPLFAVRTEALSRFSELGFPGKKNEEWRYTDISPLLQHTFSMSSGADKTAFSKKDFQDQFPFVDSNPTLVFINGVLSKELSSTEGLSNGIELKSFSAALKENAEIIKDHFSKTAPYSSDAFTALNTSLAKEGAFVLIPENVSVEKPFYLVYISGHKKNNCLTQPRNLIIAGKNSHASFVEIHASANEGSGFSNPVSEILVRENATVRFYKIEQTGQNSFLIDNTHIHQEKNSQFHSIAITFGGALVRNKLGILLGGENCETTMHGLYLGNGDSHVDNHTVMDHAFPHCYSNELYKGVMNGKASGVFSGKIVVRKDAQKTNAFQSNKNILLSDEASVNSKPQLEIFADDVKCSHGATTGQLDQEALFYLRSRGIGEESAKALLTFAFANEILEQVTEFTLREYLQTELISRLDQK